MPTGFIIDCKTQAEPTHKELVCFERELIPHNIKDIGKITPESKLTKK